MNAKQRRHAVRKQPFSTRRVLHMPETDWACASLTTGWGVPSMIALRAEFYGPTSRGCGPIDAPEIMPAGGMRELAGPASLLIGRE